MKSWIEQLHIGQLLLLLAGLAVLGFGAIAGAAASADAAVSVSYELQRHGGPIVDDSELADTATAISQYITGKRVELQRREQRFQALTWVSFGLLPIAALTAAVLLWIWFGGRKRVPTVGPHGS